MGDVTEEASDTATDYCRDVISELALSLGVVDAKLNSVHSALRSFLHNEPS